MPSYGPDGPNEHDTKGLEIKPDQKDKLKSLEIKSPADCGREAQQFALAHIRDGGVESSKEGDRRIFEVRQTAEGEVKALVAIYQRLNPEKREAKLYKGTPLQVETKDGRGIHLRKAPGLKNQSAGVIKDGEKVTIDSRVSLEKDGYRWTSVLDSKGEKIGYVAYLKISKEGAHAYLKAPEAPIEKSTPLQLRVDLPIDLKSTPERNATTLKSLAPGELILLDTSTQQYQPNGDVWAKLIDQEAWVTVKTRGEDGADKSYLKEVNPSTPPGSRVANGDQPA